MTTFYQRLAELHKDPHFRARRKANRVQADLLHALAGTGQTTSQVAQAMGYTTDDLLGVIENLTLDTLAEICEAAGLDFEVTFKTV